MIERPFEIQLRKPEPSDLEALYCQKNSPEIKALLGGSMRLQSRRDLEEWLERHRQASDELLWSIVSDPDGRCLGHVGLYKIDRVSRSAEFGIMVGEKAVWGRGIGYKATMAALRQGFLQENLNRISLTVLANNERAIKLYLRVGFSEEGRFRQALYRNGEYVDIVAMAILREEFKLAT